MAEVSEMKVKGYECIRKKVMPPGGFEPPSPDSKSCMIDLYTTGVKEANPGSRRGTPGIHPIIRVTGLYRFCRYHSRPLF